jgi:hypothetical protein
MILILLNSVSTSELSELERLEFEEALSSTVSLSLFLSKATDDKAVLVLLRFELETRNRASFVSRILGRYFTLARRRAELTLTGREWDEKKTVLKPTSF